MNAACRLVVRARKAQYKSLEKCVMRLSYSIRKLCLANKSKEYA